MPPFFRKKQLPPPKRVCILLKQARKERGITISQIAKRTKISASHLRALEECRFEDLNCSLIYKKNFIRRYVEALHMDPDPFLRQYWTEEGSYDKDEKKHPKKNYKKYQFSSLPDITRFILIGAVALILVGYIAMQIAKTFEPPELLIASPPDGYITKENIVTIEGTTETEVSIYINDEDITTDETGAFSQQIQLITGINTITIKAETKHGRTSNQTRHVVYKPE